jgi:PhoH-like ATPase
MTPIGKPKAYLLDRTVLIHSSLALMSFQDNLILLPLPVIRELDHFKRDPGERGASARLASRTMDALREHGRLTDGVPLPTGGRLQVLLPPNGSGAAKDEQSIDDQIIEMARTFQAQHPAMPTILVTKDINVRILADSLGVQAQDYITDHVALSDLYTGTFEWAAPPEAFQRFRTEGQVALPGDESHFPNEYCCLTSAANPKHSVLARVDTSGHVLLPLKQRDRVWGVRGRNREQQFALDALCNMEIPLVTITGAAGTGKTLLALAAGLQHVVQNKDFRRLIVARPTVPVGRDLGFLPGTVEEKLGPWSTPILDALDMLGDLNGKGDASIDQLMREQVIQIEALSYWRGRSLAGAFIIIDEAQNLTPLEAKTVCTRASMGSRLVLLGDLSQIDTPYLDVLSSGLSTVVSKFRGEPLAAHVELVKGERSPLAELAARLL